VIIPDSNLLLYAYNKDSLFHKKAADWWQGLLSGTEAIGLCSVALYSFIRVGTNAKAFPRPMTIDQANRHVTSWLKVANTEFIACEFDDFQRSLDLLKQAGTGGNLTTDAQIASLGIKYNAVIHSADSDFARFPEISWVNPILES
jgi:toxin-antitoxin system PIN domain toxin